MPSEPQPAKRPSWLWRLFLLLAALCLLPPLLLGARHWMLSRKINSRLEKIRSAGEPVTLNGLNSYYPAVPDAQNAALVYAQAFAELKKNKSQNFLEHFEELPGTNSLPEALREQMEKAVSENQPTIDKLRAASEFTACRYPVDYRPGWAALLPHLPALQTCGKLEFCNGIVQEQKGDTDGAIASAIFISKYAKSLDFEPDLISVVVQQKLDWEAFDLFEWILNHRKLSRQQLLRFQEIIGNSEQKDWVERAVVGERCSTLVLFHYPIRDFLDVITPNNETVSDFLGIWFLRFVGQEKRDEITYIDRLAEIRDISNLEFPRRLDKLNELRSEIRQEAAQQGFLVAGSLLPGFMNGFIKDAEHNARIRLAQTALAIELFRAEHGGPPDHLKELVPGYLPEVPFDPFDGEPLRYKKQNEGYVLYCIGPDQVDDGGEKRLSEKSKTTLSSAANPSGDIIFSVGE